jgi:transcriptional regulator with XRE-family HTH domain
MLKEQFRKRLGERIRAARRTRLDRMPLEEFGRQVAQMMGRARAFSNVTVSNWETGRQEPSWEALVTIARLTHLPLPYFAGIGEIDAYPAVSRMEPEPDSSSTHLWSMMEAVQRLDPRYQRLAVRQIESLLQDLRTEEGLAVGESRADRS